MANRKIFGYWDCPYCNSKGIRGDKRECPNCGRPRGETTKFYMKNNTDYVDEENIGKFSDKPDWMCRYCKCYNPSTVSKCIGCGAEKEEKAEDYFSLQNDKAEKTDINSSQISIDTNCTPSAQSINSAVKSRHFRITKSQILIGTAIFATLAVIGMIFYLLIPKPAVLDIRSYSWERVINIEESYISSESDWYLPADGDLRYTRQEFKETRQVIDHYETKSRQVSKQVPDGYDISYSYKDNGNGSFDEIEHRTPKYKTVYETEYYDEPVYRSEPVYATKYYYDITRWRVCDKCVTSGNDRNPYWGIPQIDTNERKGSSYENYYVTAYNLNKKEEMLGLEEFTAPYSVWIALPKTGRIKVKIGVNNSITEIIEERKLE